MGRICVRQPVLSFGAMNCSGTSCGLLLAVFAAAASGETVAELDDAAARMQYAFYTGDTQGIETILKNVDEFQVDGALAATKTYHLAYGNWKLSQLYLQQLPDQQARSNTKTLATKAAQACVRHARRAVWASRRTHPTARPYPAGSRTAAVDAAHPATGCTGSVRRI